MVAATVGVMLLLVTAMLNAAALIVVGQRRRRQETAVRAAIGASRCTLLTDVVFESLFLSLAAGALGILIAVWGIAGVRAVLPAEVPRVEDIVFGWGTVVLPTCLATGALLVAGAWSAWRQTSGTPWEFLGSGSDRTSTPRTAGQSILVGFQVAMAVVLLFGAVQLSRSNRLPSCWGSVWP